MCVCVFVCISALPLKCATALTLSLSSRDIASLAAQISVNIYKHTYIYTYIYVALYTRIYSIFISPLIDFPAAESRRKTLTVSSVCPQLNGQLVK